MQLLITKTKGIIHDSSQLSESNGVTTNQRVGRNFFYFLLIFCCFYQMGYAQNCTVSFGTPLGASQSVCNNNPASADGQVFTVCQDGDITSIQLWMNDDNTYTGTMNMWLGSYTGSTLTGGAVYQTFTVTGGTNDVGQAPVNINLITPLPVLNDGSQYLVEFATTAASNATTDAFANGGGTGGGFYGGSIDTNFDTDVAIIVTSPALAPDVPTLSEWGLILLALLLMTFGTLYLVRENREQATLVLKDK